MESSGVSGDEKACGTGFLFGEAGGVANLPFDDFSYPLEEPGDEDAGDGCPSEPERYPSVDTALMPFKSGFRWVNSAIRSGRNPSENGEAYVRGTACVH